MVSPDETPAVDMDKINVSIRRRIMQMAILHRADTGIDPLAIARFQTAGLLPGVVPRVISESEIAAISEPSHAQRIQACAGPIVFFQEEGGRSALEPATLLFHPDRRVRDAALKHVKTAADPAEPWLSRSTFDLVGKWSDDIKSDDVGRWRAAAIEIVPVIRDDVLSHIAGLRQSVATSFQEGFDTNLSRVVRPRFSTLTKFLPALFRPSYQQNDIERWVADCSRQPELAKALDAFVAQAGHVPLCDSLGVAALVDKWLENHPGTALNWAEVWRWAEKRNSATARYHALRIAITHPSVLDADSALQFWREIIRVMRGPGDNDDDSTADRQWQVNCGLTTHYILHVESLFPGLDGEIVACFAMWLAEQVGTIFGRNEAMSTYLMNEVLSPELFASQTRWEVARSLMAPSALRYAALFTNSVWAMSLVVGLQNAWDALPTSALTPEQLDAIGRIVAGYVVATPISHNYPEGGNRVYAFEGVALPQIFCYVVRCQRLLKARDPRHVLDDVIAFRTKHNRCRKIDRILGSHSRTANS